MKETDRKPAFDPADSPMDVLVRLSRFYGSDPDFVVAGGGNTSVKTAGTLHVKASGVFLATIDAGGFIAMDRKRLSILLEEDLGDDAAGREERFRQGMLAACLEKEKSLRPSVEAILHNIVPGRYVVHTHQTEVNGLCCSVRGREIARELFGGDAAWVPCVEPGFQLARAVARALADYSKSTGRDCPHALLLENHGLVVTGDTPQEILGRTDRVVGRVKQLIDSAAGQSVFGSVKRMEPARARAIVEIIGPALRALLADDAHLKIVTFDDSETALSLAGTEGGKEITAVGPVTADQVFHRSAFPLWFDPVGVESPEEIVSSLRTQIAGGSGAGQLPPRVFLVKGLGMFAAGDDFKAADAVRLTYDAAIRMMSFAKRLGGIKPLREEVRRFVEGWEWQTYRKKVSTGVRGEGRAAGKVVVVTGAAQGLGLDVSRDLAAEGAHVALTDVRSGGVMKTCREPGGKFSPEKTLVLEMDVRDARSVAEAIHRVVRTFGGLDLFVSNAGVLKAGSVKTQPEEEFDLVTDVNYKGYFRCVQKVSPIMAIQHMARPAYTSDIIQINSKSGLSGSSRNAAYAGSKFGGIGLTQSFALELLEDGIKVNAVCPGNLFDGPLWSDPVNGLFVQYLRSGKVPGARTVEDVRRAYEAKIPMGRGCTPADVMKAAYYLMEQQYETGQALPVTGGQVMLG